MMALLVATEGSLLAAFGTGLFVAMATVVVVLGAVAWGRRHGRYASSAPQRVPFIGGFEPETHAWSRFHVRYHPMSLLFIAFEMEMMFMYPWAVVFVAEGVKALAEMGMFLAILSVGIVYAAREGAFRWQ